MPVQAAGPESEHARSWVSILSAAVLLQATSAFHVRIVPTLAPVLTAVADVSPAVVGYVAAIGTAGSMAFLLAGTVLIRRLGPIRAMQVGVLLGTAGSALIAVPFWPALALGSFLIGFGYGPTAPAGSDVLQRHAPRRHRSLVFSIKQAGVPLGGVFAGLVLPPAAAVSWRFAIGLAVVLSLAPIVAVQPLRSRVDAERDAAQAVSLATLLSPANLLLPLAAMRLSPALVPLTYAAFCYAAAQGAVLTFFVTYLALELGQGLAAAGMAFAVMQATGVLGRVLLGWLADRTNAPVRMLALLGVAAAATVTATAVTTPAWPLWSLVALAGVAGITVTSWNGLYLAEVARVVPRTRIGEATSGSTLLTFLGYIVGPSAFALILETVGYRTAFFVTAAVALTATAALRPLVRAERAG
jgi:MFS family permease